MKKKISILLIAAAFLTGCQASPFDAEAETHFSKSEFSRLAADLPGENANHIVFARNTGIMKLLIPQYIADLTSDQVLKDMEIAKIEEIYLIAREEGLTEMSKNADSILIIKYQSADVATKVASSIEDSLEIDQNQQSLIIASQRNVTTDAQVELEGKFVRNASYGGEFIKYGPSIVFSEISSMEQRTASEGFWVILSSTQEDIASPVFNEDVSTIEKLKEVGQFSTSESLLISYVDDEKQQIKITLESVLDIESAITDLQEQRDLVPESAQQRLTDEINTLVEFQFAPSKAVSTLEKLHREGLMKDIQIKWHDNTLTIDYILNESSLVSRFS